LSRALLIALALLAAPAHAETVVGKPRIVDGDTLEIGQTMVRLHGIDAPEAGQTGGKGAIAAIAALSESKSVVCEGTERDDYKRLIAKCSVGQMSINAEMVRTGWAWAFVKYSSDYLDLEREARAARVGVWTAEPGATLGLISSPTPQPPWDYRAQRWKIAEQVAPNGCPIKGNISRKGERVYHAPWSPWYHKTRVSESEGERWFCSEAEALEAGWRAPYWR